MSYFRLVSYFILFVGVVLVAITIVNIYVVFNKLMSSGFSLFSDLSIETFVLGIYLFIMGWISLLLIKSGLRIKSNRV